MPNDAKIGLVLGVGLVMAVAVIFCRNEGKGPAVPVGGVGAIESAVVPSAAGPAASRPAQARPVAHQPAAPLSSEADPASSDAADH
ncbi:MAG: hypothetical protein NZ700_06690 [Gemmataceae bacterium]|nr:hypothetical protein [Gemmataceae bacterium]MDW8264552.1 hypothetical protein [Gemmataceae bacterium]